MLETPSALRLPGASRDRPPSDASWPSDSKLGISVSGKKNPRWSGGRELRSYLRRTGYDKVEPGDDHPGSAKSGSVSERIMANVKSAGSKHEDHKFDWVDDSAGIHTRNLHPVEGRRSNTHAKDSGARLRKDKVPADASDESGTPLGDLPVPPPPPGDVAPIPARITVHRDQGGRSKSQSRSGRSHRASAEKGTARGRAGTNSKGHGSVARSASWCSRASSRPASMRKVAPTDEPDDEFGDLEEPREETSWAEASESRQEELRRFRGNGDGSGGGGKSRDRRTSNDDLHEWRENEAVNMSHGDRSDPRRNSQERRTGDKNSHQREMQPERGRERSRSRGGRRQHGLGHHEHRGQSSQDASEEKADQWETTHRAAGGGEHLSNRRRRERDSTRRGAGPVSTSVSAAARQQSEGARGLSHDAGRNHAGEGRHNPRERDIERGHDGGEFDRNRNHSLHHKSDVAAAGVRESEAEHRRRHAHAERHNPDASLSQDHGHRRQDRRGEREEHSSTHGNRSSGAAGGDTKGSSEVTAERRREESAEQHQDRAERRKSAGRKDIHKMLMEEGRRMSTSKSPAPLEGDRRRAVSQTRRPADDRGVAGGDEDKGQTEVAPVAVVKKKSNSTRFSSDPRVRKERATRLREGREGRR